MEKSKKEVLVLEDILGSNKKIASSIRKKLEDKGILAVNLLARPVPARPPCWKESGFGSRTISKWALLKVT